MSIHAFSILTVGKKFILFGGIGTDKNNKSEFQKAIAQFDPVQDSWTKLGDLKVARLGHGVIQLDNDFIVIGGNSQDSKTKIPVPTETCKLNGESIICTEREPKLLDFLYSKLMLIQ